jgi:hypothetical protein
MVYRDNSATFGPMQFPLVLRLKYKTISPKGKAISGTGSTVLLSSADIVFNADQPLGSGVRCEIAIAWPVLLESRIRLQLVLQSVITRSEDQFVMGRVSEYEFRTRGPESNIFE